MCGGVRLEFVELVLCDTSWILVESATQSLLSMRGAPEKQSSDKAQHLRRRLLRLVRGREVAGLVAHVVELLVRPFDVGVVEGDLLGGDRVLAA